MAFYTCVCSACGETRTERSSIDERHNIKSTCCKAPVKRLPDAPMVSAGVWTGHKGFVAHENGGKPVFIESASDHKAFLKRNDLMPASEGYSHADASKATMKVERKQRLRKYAEERVRALPS